MLPRQLAREAVGIIFTCKTKRGDSVDGIEDEFLPQFIDGFECHKLWKMALHVFSHLHSVFKTHGFIQVVHLQGHSRDVGCYDVL